MVSVGGGGGGGGGGGVCVFLCVDARDHLLVHSSGAITLFFETESFRGICSLPVKLSLSASVLKSSPQHLPSIKVCTTMFGFCIWVLGLKLKSSCLQIKRFTN